MARQDRSDPQLRERARRGRPRTDDSRARACSVLQIAAPGVADVKLLAARAEELAAREGLRAVSFLAGFDRAGVRVLNLFCFPS